MYACMHAWCNFPRTNSIYWLVTNCLLLSGMCNNVCKGLNHILPAPIDAHLAQNASKKCVQKPQIFGIVVENLLKKDWNIFSAMINPLPRDAYSRWFFSLKKIFFPESPQNNWFYRKLHYEHGELQPAKFAHRKMIPTKNKIAILRAISQLFILFDCMIKKINFFLALHTFSSKIHNRQRQ